MFLRRCWLLVFILCVNPVFASAATFDDWLPVSSDELSMKAEPQAPGAPAIYLYRQVDRDDGAGRETHYVRIKVLTEEGRKQADIEIPFLKGVGIVNSIKARTIRPDGSIRQFDGQIYEKTVVKAKGVQFLAKTFTLSDVQVGGIIEYRYVVDLNRAYVFDSHWTLSGDLFTKRARFSLKKNAYFALRTTAPAGLPAGAEQPRLAGDTMRMEAQNIPAFQTEDYMPPEDQLKYRIDFVYFENNPEPDQAKFWKQEVKRRLDRYEDFAKKKKAIEQAVLEAIAPGDSSEVKVQKIYARVQRIRNTSWEREKTEQEQKRDKDKMAKDIEEVWKRGVGSAQQINWAFVALARAADLEAYPVAICIRDRACSSPAFMNPYELSGSVVVVEVNGQDVYLDPGTPYAPYGFLPWQENGVPGLRLDKVGGRWITTSIPKSSASRIDRKAELALNSEGTLEGKMSMAFQGIEAIRMRIEEREEDEQARKTYLENLLKEAIPAGAEVELTNRPDWSGPAPSLLAEFHVRIPGWTSGAGQRAFFPVGLLGGHEKHLFEHAERVHDICFQSPYQKVDDLSITLPDGWKIDSIPDPVKMDAKLAFYSEQVERQTQGLRIHRTLRSEMMTVDVSQYDPLRRFFQRVRQGDEQQAVLRAGD